MSLEALETTDLIGAYLSGDVAQEERAAVEQLLADDVLKRELLDELRDLCVLLKAGESQASPESLEILRKIVRQKIDEKRLQTLVAISATGDVTDAEKQEVQAYLKLNPSAAASQRQVAAMSALLNAGQISAGDSASEKLRQRMKNLLPAGAMAARSAAPVTAVSSTVAPSQQSARSQVRPSLRVFVKTENPWNKRWAVAGGLAAMVALAFGVRSFLTHGGTSPHGGSNPDVVIVKTGSNDGATVGQSSSGQTTPLPHRSPENGNGAVKDEPIVADTPKVPAPVPVPVERPNVITNQNVNNTPVVPPKAPNEGPVKLPVEPQTPDTIVKNNGGGAVAPQPPKAPDANSPNNTNDNTVANRNDNPSANNPKAPVTGDNTVQKPTDTVVVIPNPIVPPAPPVPAVAQNNSNQTGNGSTNTNGTTINNTNGGGGVAFAPAAVPNTGATTPPVAPSPAISTPKPTSLGTTIPPVDGSAVLGALTGTGAIQVTDAAGNALSLQKVGDNLPSGATIQTDGQQAALILPGNGRLYIEKASTLTITFSASDTAITLNGGEVYYIAPSGGNLTLTAGKASALRVTEADLTLIAGRLTVANFGNSTLDLKNQRTKSVPSGQQASVATGSSEPPKFDIPATLNGLWRTTVLPAGDGIAAPKKRSAR